MFPAFVCRNGHVCLIAREYSIFVYFWIFLFLFILEFFITRTIVALINILLIYGKSISVPQYMFKTNFDDTLSHMLKIKSLIDILKIPIYCFLEME